MTTHPRVHALERATGRSWEAWLEFMDGIGAEHLDHYGIALKVFEELEGTMDNPGWWAQGVTVAYEQYLGRRVPGQRPDGTFQTSVSKSTRLAMRELMDAWTAFAAEDREVCGLIAGGPRVSGTDKRITWRTKATDGSSVVITSEPKAAGASIIATQFGLATHELNMEAKARWAAIVNRFLGGL